uniref:Uncharacterized protein n=1 Tax=Acrobeloides nanus TaxID=290746 RepID=A0A914DV49_9BILA
MLAEERSAFEQTDSEQIVQPVLKKNKKTKRTSISWRTTSTAREANKARRWDRMKKRYSQKTSQGKRKMCVDNPEIVSKVVEILKQAKEAENAKMMEDGEISKILIKQEIPEEDAHDDQLPTSSYLSMLPQSIRIPTKLKATTEAERIHTIRTLRMVPKVNPEKQLIHEFSTPKIEVKEEPLEESDGPESSSSFLQSSSRVSKRPYETQNETIVTHEFDSFWNSSESQNDLETIVEKRKKPKKSQANKKLNQVKQEIEEEAFEELLPSTSQEHFPYPEEVLENEDLDKLNSCDIGYTIGIAAFLNEQEKLYLLKNAYRKPIEAHMQYVKGFRFLAYSVCHGGWFCRLCVLFHQLEDEEDLVFVNKPCNDFMLTHGFIISHQRNESHVAASKASREFYAKHADAISKLQESTDEDSMAVKIKALADYYKNAAHVKSNHGKKNPSNYHIRFDESTPSSSQFGSAGVRIINPSDIGYMVGQASEVPDDIKIRFLNAMQKKKAPCDGSVQSRIVNCPFLAYSISRMGWYCRFCVLFPTLNGPKSEETFFISGRDGDNLHSLHKVQLHAKDPKHLLSMYIGNRFFEKQSRRVPSYGTPKKYSSTIKPKIVAPKKPEVHYSIGDGQSLESCSIDIGLIDRTNPIEDKKKYRLLKDKSFMPPMMYERYETEFPFLLYSPELKGFLCKYCILFPQKDLFEPLFLVGVTGITKYMTDENLREHLNIDYHRKASSDAKLFLERMGCDEEKSKCISPIEQKPSISSLPKTSSNHQKVIKVVSKESVAPKVTALPSPSVKQPRKQDLSKNATDDVPLNRPYIIQKPSTFSSGQEPIKEILYRSHIFGLKPQKISVTNVNRLTEPHTLAQSQQKSPEKTVLRITTQSGQTKMIFRGPHAKPVGPGVVTAVKVPTSTQKLTLNRPIKEENDI